METTINNNSKDRVFKLIFGRNENREWTLSLYNAVNGSSYTNPEDITITTVEDALYLSMKNDVSFLIAETMNLYEHQSTYNPNMPVRMLMYAGMVYSKYTEEKDINMYSSALKRLPVPRLVTFYNGIKETEDRVILRLSDAFPEGSNPDIEVTVLMLNINYGRNRELMEHCKPLNDYSQFVETMRRLKSEGLPPEESVHLAIRRLDNDSPIRKYLLANEAEVKMLAITEYDEKRQRELDRRDGEERLARLILDLKQEGRVDDVFRAAEDAEFRDKLFEERGID